MIGEGYRKRQYEAHFMSKCSDADMENTETQIWLDFALECGYISQRTYVDFVNKSEEIGRLLNHMIQNPKKYLSRNNIKNTLPTNQLQTVN